MQNDLVVGKKYKISMNFISILNDDLIGFYRSSYEESGITKYKSCERTYLFFILTTRMFWQILGRFPIWSAGRPKSFPLFWRAQHESRLHHHCGSQELDVGHQQHATQPNRTHVRNY